MRQESAQPLTPSAHGAAPIIWKRRLWAAWGWGTMNHKAEGPGGSELACVRAEKMQLLDNGRVADPVGTHPPIPMTPQHPGP